MERVRGIGEHRRDVTAGLCFVELWMEDDVCALPYGVADSFRIGQPSWQMTMPNFKAPVSKTVVRSQANRYPPRRDRVGLYPGNLRMFRPC